MFNVLAVQLIHLLKWSMLPQLGQRKNTITHFLRAVYERHRTSVTRQGGERGYLVRRQSYTRKA